MYISGLLFIINVKVNNICITKLRICYSVRYLICILGKILLFININIMGIKIDKKIIRERLYRSLLGVIKWLESVFNFEL